MEVLLSLFLMLSSMSFLAFLSAVIFALIGFVSKSDVDQNKYYALASKILLIATLMVLVGLGSCFAYAFTY